MADLQQLDSTWLYYQNPTTGSASSSPTTVRQACRLLAPVKEGMKSVLAADSQCLMTETQPQQWQAAREIPILREASASWYISTDPTKACSIRKLQEYRTSGSILVCSPGVTDGWVALTTLPYLQLALEAVADQQNNKTLPSGNGSREENEQDELDNFFSSATDDNEASSKPSDESEDLNYRSDGGTTYVKDHITGNWIHEALALPQGQSHPSSSNDKVVSDGLNFAKPGPKKQKKAKFSKRNAKHWIYVSGLPTAGVAIEDLHSFFGRCGLIDIDPETQTPKIKLYSASDGTLKGDASVCYAKTQSVDTALRVLDEAPWDEKYTLKIEKAKFEAKTEGNKKRKRPVSEAKRKVARLALRQAQDEGFGGRLSGGRKGLCIVVVKNMMNGISDAKLELEIQNYCKEHGEVEKITCVDKTKTVIIKFNEPAAAATAVKAWNGKSANHSGKPMEAVYWDGVTNYIQDDENPDDEEDRHDQFGDWLETQEELPPELQLKVADE